MCWPGFTGADCSARVCHGGSHFYGHSPVDGKRVRVGGSFFITGKCFLSSGPYTCTFTYGDGASDYLLTTAKVVSDNLLECVVPGDLQPRQYTNTADGTCVVQPEAAFTLTATDVAVGRSRSAHARLMRCKPGLHGGQGCGPHGTCGPTGQCLCKFRSCGNYCQDRPGSTTFAFNGLDVAHFYHLTSRTGFRAIGGSDVQGTVAVGGYTTISMYSVADQIATPVGDDLFTETKSDGTSVTRTTRDDFVICGRIDFLSGAIMGGGNMVYMDPDSVIVDTMASVEPPGIAVQLPVCPLDFDALYWGLQDFSTGLLNLPRTGTTVFKYTCV